MIRLLIQIAFVLNVSPKLQVLGFGSDFLCARIPGLTAKQREICENAPDSLVAIGDGTRLGLAECQDQFRNSRWNCSTISGSVGHIAVVGSREAAFLYAISSASVTYSIAQGCARGNVSACGCAPPTTVSTSVTSAAPRTSANVTIAANRVFHEWNTISGWKWGGCSIDILFATKLARIFLDSREIERDARSFMNMHNNKAGRKAVQNTLETQCKCHGLSGSCTLKTCWLKLPAFKRVGDMLMEKYNSAQHVYAVKSKINQRSQEHRKKRKRIQLYVRPKSKRANSWGNQYDSGSGFRRLRARSQEFAMLRAKMKRRVQIRVRPKHTSLVYLEESPNYCELDSLKSVLGTKSRPCKRGVGPNTGTSAQEDGSCEILCCGRGYSTYEILKKWKCQCKFTWCCTVECDECEQLTEVYTCN